MGNVGLDAASRQTVTPGVERDEYVIAPPQRLCLLDVRELWRYRDLFLVMAWRDIAVRYKQTALGVMWAVLQPVVTMLVFSFIFNRMAKIGSGDSTPYPVFVFVGLSFWLYFSGTVTNAANSLVLNAPLIQKTYFPRVILPFAAVIAGLVDLCIAGLVLGVLMACYGFPPRLVGLAIVPVLVISSALSAAGLGLLMAALNVKYRDVRYALPFFIQLMIYVTPIIYPITMLEKHPVAKTMMVWLNPMSGVIANARAGLLGRTPVDWNVMGITLLMSGVLFLVGLSYFRRTEHYFADIA